MSGARALAVAILLSTAITCGCLQEDAAPGPDLGLEVVGAVAVPGVWNASGAVMAPEGQALLLLEMRVWNNGTRPVQGLASTDISVRASSAIYVCNFLSGDISVIDTHIGNGTDTLEPSTLPTGVGPLGIGAYVAVRLVYLVPVGLLDTPDAVITLANATLLGKGGSVSTPLDLGRAVRTDHLPPRLTLKVDGLLYLNRTPPGGQSPRRYLVANLTVTNRGSGPFPLELHQLRLLDDGDRSHPVEEGVPWLNDGLEEGPLAPGASRAGVVAFEIQAPASPMSVELGDTVPAIVGLDPTGIAYGK